MRSPIVEQLANRINQEILSEATPAAQDDLVDQGTSHRSDMWSTPDGLMMNWIQSQHPFGHDHEGYNIRDSVMSFYNRYRDLIDSGEIVNLNLARWSPEGGDSTWGWGTPPGGPPAGYDYMGYIQDMARNYAPDWQGFGSFEGWYCNQFDCS